MLSKSGMKDLIFFVKSKTSQSDIGLVDAALEETGIGGSAAINFEDCTNILTMRDVCIS